MVGTGLFLSGTYDPHATIFHTSTTQEERARVTVVREWLQSERLISDDGSGLKRGKEQKARWTSSVSSKTDHVTDNRQQENRKQKKHKIT